MRKGVINDFKEDQVISEKTRTITTGTIFDTPKIMSKRGYLVNLPIGRGT